MVLQKISYKWWVLITVSVASIMVSIDLSILTTCLPHLAAVFHTDSTVIGWLNIVYFIMTQSLMLTLAKVGDAVGRKRVFATGVACYVVGLFIASISHSVGQLIIARVFQGAAGATILSLGMAITVATFPTDERGKALGVLMGSASIGLVAGPMLGGFILDFLGWRAVFYSRIPFMIASLVMTLVIIKEQKSEDRKSFRFDILGAVSLFIWLSCLLLFLSFGGKWGVLAAPSISLFVTTILFFAIFIITERKASEPIVLLSVFKKWHFTAAIITTVVSTIGSSSAVFLVPFFLIHGLGFSNTVVGGYMALLALPTVLLSPLSGKLSDRMGSTFLSTLGVVVVCAGMFWFIMVGAGTNPVNIAIGIVLIGSGLGIFHPPNNSALVGSLPKEMLGVASAIGSTARQIGTSLALAISGALYGGSVVRHASQLEAKGLDLTSAKKMASMVGFTNTLKVTLIIAFIGILTSIFRGSDRKNYGD
jgi:EmrB/QacA subfamily drug resistance transporter